MKQNFTADDIKRVERTNNIDDAKNIALEILERANPNISKHGMKIEKLLYLQKNINEASSPMDIVKLMYNTLLSGEGLATLSSYYQQKYAR